ncbi:endonuclease/exonuclease/phosphatase family protein [Streptomyces sp. NPDC059785]|uniref:endonuclease/exonuclease/phosphatase family protein n=1 Tax=Streptomyces sp. NPDC059785 TaxID=3346945 RepID=UPI00365C66AB
MHLTFKARLSRAGVASAALTALTLPLAGTATAQADPAPLRVPAQVNAMTWNICGGSQSSCVGTGTAEEKLDRVIQRVNQDSTLTVIALQEVCSFAHAARLQERLGEQWVVNFRAAPVMGGEHGELNRCTLANLPAPKNQPGGVLVAMKKLPGASITVVDEDFVGVPYANDKDGHPTQGAACLRDSVNKLLACSSHFPFDGADKEKGTEFDSRSGCAKQYAALGKKWRARGWRTILAGDLNLNVLARSELLRIWPLYSGGNFEGDRLNRTTAPSFPFDKKLDYIFFSANNWQRRGAAVDKSEAISSLSDHYLLKATVRPIR